MEKIGNCFYFSDFRQSRYGENLLLLLASSGIPTLFAGHTAFYQENNGFKHILSSHLT